MSDIQRYEPWPQEWPMEDANGDLVTYEDHRKVVEAIEAKLAKAVEQSNLLLQAYDTWANCEHGTQEDQTSAAMLFSRTRYLRTTLAEISSEAALNKGESHE